jgi:hypothetical protein
MIRRVIIYVPTLAALATVAAWVFSYRSPVFLHVDDWPTEPRSRYFTVLVSRGTVWGSCDMLDYRPMTAQEVSSYSPASVDRYARGHTRDNELLPGFGCRTGSRTVDCDVQRSPPSCTQLRSVSVYFPSWLVLMLFAAYPTIAFIRGPLWRWRRRRKGLCVKCGYDLTGNVSGVCPECGTEVKQP